MQSNSLSFKKCARVWTVSPYLCTINHRLSHLSIIGVLIGQFQRRKECRRQLDNPWSFSTIWKPDKKQGSYRYLCPVHISTLILQSSACITCTAHKRCLNDTNFTCNSSLPSSPYLSFTPLHCHLSLSPPPPSLPASVSLLPFSPLFSSLSLSVSLPLSFSLYRSPSACPSLSPPSLSLCTSDHSGVNGMTALAKTVFLLCPPNTAKVPEIRSPEWLLLFTTILTATYLHIVILPSKAEKSWVSRSKVTK